MGLNSGEVVVRAIGSDLHMDYTAVGQTTHLAARMDQLADPGTTLLAPATVRLAEDYVQVESRGLVTVKGLPEPIEIYLLTGARARSQRLRLSSSWCETLLRSGGVVLTPRWGVWVITVPLLMLGSQAVPIGCRGQ